MGQVERDPVTGTKTTGHEWDGIKELNSPLPKWWVYVFYGTVIWSFLYMMFFPAVPTTSAFSTGLLGYSSRQEVEDRLARQYADRQAWLARFEDPDVTPATILADTELRSWALAGGEWVFAENCAPCHQSGGAGAYGYPNLADDEWMWGGTPDAIYTSIYQGIRQEASDDRFSMMPAYGADGLLSREEIDQVATYVHALSRGEASGDMAGAEIFANECTACHGESGEGMAMLGAPALNNQIWMYGGTVEDIKKQLWQPQHGVMPTWSERLDDATIKMLAAYVHALGGGEVVDAEPIAADIPAPE